MRGQQKELGTSASKDLCNVVFPFLWLSLHTGNDNLLFEKLPSSPDQNKHRLNIKFCNIESRHCNTVTIISSLRYEIIFKVTKKHHVAMVCYNTTIILTAINVNQVIEKRKDALKIIFFACLWQKAIGNENVNRWLNYWKCRSKWDFISKSGPLSATFPKIN